MNLQDEITNAREAWQTLNRQGKITRADSADASSLLARAASETDEERCDIYLQAALQILDQYDPNVWGGYL